MNPTRKALANLGALHTERGELLRKLDQSLVIQESVPQAFAHGSCRIAWCSQQGRIVGGTLTDGAGNTYPVTADLAKEMGVEVEDLTPTP